MTEVAHVGAFNRRSKNDSGRTATALMWLVKNGHRDFLNSKPTNDIINLKYGRDFLTESYLYDVVVVHAVFDAKWPIEKLPKELDPAQVSPLHTYEAWQRRLVETKATFIFVFEGLPCSLNGWNLGELPGYTIRHRDWLFTVYQRKEEKEKSL